MDRLQSSTLLDDRRDACRALKALSRTYRVEVGAQGMDALRQVLEMDRTDCEIIGLALDTLCNITNPETFDEEGRIVFPLTISFMFNCLMCYFSRRTWSQEPDRGTVYRNFHQASR